MRKQTVAITAVTVVILFPITKFFLFLFLFLVIFAFLFRFQELFKPLSKVILVMCWETYHKAQYVVDFIALCLWESRSEQATPSDVLNALDVCYVLANRDVGAVHPEISPFKHLRVYPAISFDPNFEPLLNFVEYVVVVTCVPHDHFIHVFQSDSKNLFLLA